MRVTSRPSRSGRATGPRLALGAIAIVLPLAAAAELSNDSMLGAGLRSRPAYDGADARHTEIVPVIRYLGEPWFLRSTQGVLEGGLRTALASGLHLGTQLAYEAGRQSSESRFLQDRHLGTIARGASLGLQLEWDQAFGPVPTTWLARTRSNTDRGLGTQADLRLSAGVFQHAGFGAGVFAQATWADAKATRAYHGVDAAAAAASGLPVFRPGSGWLSTSLGLLWSVDLGRQWIVVGSLEARRLRGDAAHSPLTQSRSNPAASAGLAYRY